VYQEISSQFLGVNYESALTAKGRQWRFPQGLKATRFCAAPPGLFIIFLRHSQG